MRGGDWERGRESEEEQRGEELTGGTTCGRGEEKERCRLILWNSWEGGREANQLTV